MTNKRYKGFISHSSKDWRFAKRLSGALENYTVPKGISSDSSDRRRKLGRFFRDTDELGTSLDLGETLRGAISESENLIVICSPNSVDSPWVNEEISAFRSGGLPHRIHLVNVRRCITGPDKRIGHQGLNIWTRLAARLFANLKQVLPFWHSQHRPPSDLLSTLCVPKALRNRGDTESDAERSFREPLVLDLERDGFSRLKIRLIASILGIRFDDLWRRDRKRAWARRGLWTLVISGVVATLVFGFILVFSALTLFFMTTRADQLDRVNRWIYVDRLETYSVVCNSAYKLSEIIGLEPTPQRVGIPPARLIKIKIAASETLRLCIENTSRPITTKRTIEVCSRLVSDGINDVSPSDGATDLASEAFSLLNRASSVCDDKVIWRKNIFENIRDLLSGAWKKQA